MGPPKATVYRFLAFGVGVGLTLDTLNEPAGPPAGNTGAGRGLASETEGLLLEPRAAVGDVVRGSPLGETDSALEYDLAEYEEEADGIPNPRPYPALGLALGSPGNDMGCERVKDSVGEADLSGPCGMVFESGGVA